MTDDPLLGCRLKLQNAWRHRQALGEELREFLSRTDPEPSPLHLGVIVGDFLHNLRCVLDHVVWQLVELNGQEPGDYNQFPIFDTASAYKKKAGRYLRGVAPDHSALIEAFQPHHLDAGPAYHSLAVLRDLSNIDKHRFVHPVVIVGEGDAREVRFIELEVTTDALFRLEHYITYIAFKRFEELFPLPTHAADNLIARWPRAWADLLAGGRGIRPRRGVGAIKITPVSWIHTRDALGYSVQVARVAPIPETSPQDYNDDGWPVGFTPPRGLRSRVRRALARQQERKRAIAPETDPCHGYAWYPRWTDRRLADVVREIGHTDAFSCLRHRLATDRGWSEAELQARLDPLQHSARE